VLVGAYRFEVMTRYSPDGSVEWQRLAGASDVAIDAEETSSRRAVTRSRSLVKTGKFSGGTIIGNIFVESPSTLRETSS
jgi:hypothetical protein